MNRPSNADMPDDRCEGCDHKRETHQRLVDQDLVEWGECLSAYCDCGEFEEGDGDFVA